MDKTTLIENISKFSELFKILGESVDKWSSLPHSLAGLDVLLKHNLVEMKVKTKKGKVWTVICSSNYEFVRRICSVDLKAQTDALKTKTGKNPFAYPSTKSINTWNFKRRSFFGISSNDWEIKSIIEIRESNMELLTKIIQKLINLKK